MNLRTRIALFVGIATLLLSLIFVAQVVLSVRMTDQAARRDTTLLIEAMWQSFVEDEIAVQESAANRVRRDVELLNALSRETDDVVRMRMNMVAMEQGTEQRITLVVNMALRPIYDNLPFDLPASFATQLTPLVRATDTEGFAEFDLGDGRRPYRIKIAPLRFRFGVVGYVIVAAPASRIVERLDDAVDLDARLISSTAESDVTGDWTAAASGELIPIRDGLGDGRTIAYLDVSNDRTAELRQTRWLQWIVGGLVIVFVGRVLGGLVWMVKRAFRPLDAAIDVIDKLTQGEEAPPLDTSTGTIEIQRLSRAVEALRAAHAAQESLRQIQAELAIASELQQALLPREPLVKEGVSLHGQMIPSQEVAGDYFDYFVIDENRVGFVIADVCGKGTPAALFMAMSRTVVRSVALTGQAPGVVLAEANRVLAETNDKNMFVTLFYGVFDRVLCRLSYANAGHVPPILKTSEGEVSYLPATGDLVLGMIGDLDYETIDMPLAEGSLLVGYTDGIPEALNSADEQFGDDRLLSLVRDTQTHDSEKLMDELRAAVLEFADGRAQYDDITLCIASF